MSERKIRILLFLSLTALMIVFTGCGSNSSYEKQQYLLEAQRSSSTQTGNSQSIIEIRRFTIDSAFSAKSLTYRTSKVEFKSDFYNEFLISPVSMITEKTRNWLSASGLFQRVLDQGSYLEPTHVIEANIISCYGDYRDKLSPNAVMEIRFFLLETKAGKEPIIVFGKSYKSHIPLEFEGPAGLISALDSCLVEILTDLEKDIFEKLS
jgi:hypothetical protein